MKRLLVFLVISASVVTQAASSVAMAQTVSSATAPDHAASGNACGPAIDLPKTERRSQHHSGHSAQTHHRIHRKANVAGNDHVGRTSRSNVQQSCRPQCRVLNDAQDKFSGAQFSDFITNPQALLKRNPIGGLQLSGEVKGLTVTDPLAAVDALLNIARSANSAQAAAIGSGLGQAVKAILAVDKSCGEDLARKITGSGLEDLLTAYNMAIAETPMLLDGGSGGGVGGVVNGTSSSSTGVTTSAGGSTSHTNTAETFSFSGSTYTCSTSVSPRRKC